MQDVCPLLGNVRGLIMKNHTLHIKKAVILITDGTDKVSLHTTLPSPYPPEVSAQDLMIDFDTKKGAGVDYVRKHFGIEPDVIDVQRKIFRLDGKTIVDK